MSIINDLQEQKKFSAAEKGIADYILSHKSEVLLMSVQDLSKNAYTSPSAVIRLCKKINLSGFSALKIALATELQKIEDPKHSSINPDFPLSPNDSIQEISKKIYQLTKETLSDSYRKFSTVQFRKAIRILENHKRLAIFAIGDTYINALSFRNKMMKINIDVLMSTLPNEDGQFAATLNEKDAAIIISYSGNTKYMVTIAKILKVNKVPFVLITSDKESKIAEYASAILEVSNKESSYIKFSNFSSSLSIDFMLNNIYSYFFVKNYQEHSELRNHAETIFMDARFHEDKKQSS